MNELKRFLLSIMLMFVCTAIAYSQTEITGKQPSYSPMWVTSMLKCQPAMAWSLR